MDDKSLDLIRSARAELMLERDCTSNGKSREIALVLTKLEEAEMWRERDIRRKRGLGRPADLPEGAYKAKQQG